MRKNKFKFLLLLLFVIVFTLPNNVYAGSVRYNTSTGSAKGEGQANAPDGYVAGSKPSFRVGLSYLRTDNGVYDSSITASSPSDVKAAAIQKYANTHYVGCDGTAYMLAGESGTGNNTYRYTQGETANKIYSVSSGPIADLLRELENPTGSLTYLVKSADGSYAINPAKVNALMGAFYNTKDSYNQELYNSWLKENMVEDAARNPVVIVVEVQGFVVAKNKHYLVSSGDMAVWNGGNYDTLRNTDLNQLDKVKGSYSSLTDRAIAGLVGYAGGSVKDTWPQRWTKHMFCTWWDANQASCAISVSKNPKVWTNWANQAYMTGSRNGALLHGMTTGGAPLTSASDADTSPTLINGCSILVIGEPVPEVLKFTWKLDGNDAVHMWSTNTDGQDRSNETIQCPEGYTKPKVTNLSDISFKQENATLWQNYFNSKGMSTFTITLNPKYSATSQDYASLNTNPLGVELRVNGVTQPGNTYTTDLNGMMSIIRGDTPIKIYSRIQSNKSTNFGAFRLSASINTNAGPLKVDDGKDVNWICYTDSTANVMTYDQKVKIPTAQVQSNEVLGEKYNVGAGVPTTENLYVEMGGEQYIVKMQMILADSTYKRKHTFVRESAPNAIYYNVSNGNFASSTTTTTKTVTVEDTTVAPAWSTGLTHTDEVQSNMTAEWSKYSVDNIVNQLIANVERCDEYGHLTPTTYTVNQGPGVSLDRDELRKKVKSFVMSCQNSVNSSSISITAMNVDDPDCAAKSYSTTVTVNYNPHTTFWATDTYTTETIDDGPCTNPDHYEVPGVHDASPGGACTYNKTTLYTGQSVWTYQARFGFTTTVDNSDSNIVQPTVPAKTDTFYQSFTNVKYLDITNASVWLMDNGMVANAVPSYDGTSEQYAWYKDDDVADEDKATLGTLITNDNLAQNIMLAAVNQLGYYNYDATTDATTFKYDKGTGTYKGTFMDGESYGRLVNSYKQLASSANLTLAVEQFGDAIRWTYSPRNDGGRTHYSASTWAYSNLAYELSRVYNDIVVTNDALMLESGVTKVNKDNVSTSNAWQDWSSGWYQSNANATSTRIMRPQVYQQYHYNTVLTPDVSKPARVPAQLNNATCGTTRSLNYVTSAMNALNPAGVGAAYINNNQCYMGTIPESNGANTIGFLGTSGSDQRSWAEDAKKNCEFKPEDLATEKNVTVNGKSCVFRKDLANKSAKTQKGSGTITPTGNANDDNAYDSAQHTSTTLQPFFTKLDIKRTLANSIYRSGFATVNYGQVVSVVAQSGGTAEEIGWIIPSDSADISKVSRRLDSYSYTDAVGTSLRTIMDDKYVVQKGLSLNARYDNGTGTHLTLNNIVVFNPLGMTVKYNDLSVKLPDGTNEAKASDENNPLRDQRVLGYSILQGQGQNDVLLTEDKGSSVSLSSNVVYEEQHTLKDTSLEATSYYTEADYDINSEETVINEIICNTASGVPYTYTNSSSYTKDIQIRGNSVSDMYSVVRLPASRSLIARGSAIYMSGRSAAIDYATILDYAVEQADPNMVVKDIKLEGTVNSKLVMDLAQLGTLNKGEVFTATITTDTLAQKPTDVKVYNIDGVESSDIYSMYSATSLVGGSYVTKYTFEMKEDAIVDNITFSFGNGTSISNLELYFDEIFICDLGSNITASGTQIDTADVNATYGPTQNFLYTGNASTLRSSATREQTYNSFYYTKVSYPTVTTTLQTSINERWYYMAEYVLSYSKTLKVNSEMNPHKVENAFWKMHVLGWETASGDIIKSVNDSLLAYDNTKLKWPNLNEYITVADLRANGVLVRYMNKVYLTTLAGYLNNEILESGMRVHEFDKFTFSDSINLEDSSVAVDTSVHNAGGLSYSDKIYTWAFNVTFSNAPVYEVRSSKSMEHRYSYDAITKISVDNLGNPALTADWMVDWDLTKVVVEDESYTPKADEVPRFNNSVFVNLDDEFSIYYDNYNTMGAINADSNKPVTLGTKDLAGYGFTNITPTSNLNVTGDTSYNPKTIKNLTHIDTSKWIYRKTATFAYDVFFFGNPNRPYSVALDMARQQASSGNISVSDALARMTVFVPAGTPVDLGTYTSFSEFNNPSTLENLSSPYNRVVDPQYNSYVNSNIRPNDGVTHTGFPNLEENNDAHFMDYGKSFSGNGKGTGGGDEYTYYFWCALSSGESKSSSMTLRTYGINDRHDEPTSDIISNRKSLGDKLRFTGITKTLECDVVGRVGALTMLDTGDYRFSSSFKTTDNASDWLVFGLIRKIMEYNNEPGVPSTQSKYLSDMFDVRGRNAYTYEVQSKLGDRYNTYSTQWFKNSSSSTLVPGAVQVGLPLTGEFNDVPSLRGTEQKLGYLNYMSLETIGSYFGQSTHNGDSSATDGSGDVTREDVPTVNVNKDYGQYKIQVRPVYLGVDNDGNWFPVDVYAKDSLGKFSMINVAPRTSADTITQDEYNKLLHNTYKKNTYNYYLERNTNPYKLTMEKESDLGVIINKTSDSVLGQSLMRRMITELEALNTEYVVRTYNGLAKEGYDAIGVTDYKELFDDWNSFLDEDEDSPVYYLGNAQFINLRSACRTFVGGQSLPLAGADATLHATFKAKSGGADQYVPSDTFPYVYNAQKWQFNLGLPSSAVFVRHGEALTKNAILNGRNYKILTTVQVYANGSVWMLGYKNAPTRVSIESQDYDYTQWNVYADDPMYLVPVSFYDLTEATASIDLSESGTH